MENKRRHILYLNADRGIPVWGESGGSAHIRDFTSAALRRGWDVTIVTARRQDPAGSAPPAPVHKIKFRRSVFTFLKSTPPCGGDDILKEIRSFYANSVLSQQLPALAKKNDFTLVYERYSLFSFAGLNFARRYAFPYALEVNAPLIEEALRHRQLHLQELAHSVARYVFSSADRIIAVSSEVAQYVRSIAPQANVTVLPNAVDPSRFRAGETQEKRSAAGDAVAKSLSHLREKFVVGYLGSLRPWHGLDNLLDAFSTFSRREPRTHLLIIGAGKALRPELEAKCDALGIRERVTFTGETANAQVPHYLAYCDALVAPYPALERFYFSPLKIFEYMASGKPIIASDIGQISELLSDNETALLVKPGSRDELVAAMIRIRQNPLFAKVLAERAYSIARKSHSWDSRICQMETVFDELQSQSCVKQAV